MGKRDMGLAHNEQLSFPMGKQGGNIREEARGEMKKRANYSISTDLSVIDSYTEKC